MASAACDTIYNMSNRGSERPYNNRELDTFFSSMSAQLDRIEHQAKLTNGRVSKNEKNVIQLRTRINTAIWALSITLPVILALAAFIYIQQMKNVEDLEYKIQPLLNDL